MMRKTVVHTAVSTEDRGKRDWAKRVQLLNRVRTRRLCRARFSMCRDGTGWRACRGLAEPDAGAAVLPGDARHQDTVRRMMYSLADKTPALPQMNRYWIAPNAAVIGDVQLGIDVSVWFGATLRGDEASISVGDGSNIQDGCVLHADPGVHLRIGSGVTVGHAAIL